jgi:hypothetical protein
MYEDDQQSGPWKSSDSNAPHYTPSAPFKSGLTARWLTVDNWYAKLLVVLYSLYAVTRLRVPSCRARSITQQKYLHYRESATLHRLTLPWSVVVALFFPSFGSTGDEWVLSSNPHQLISEAWTLPIMLVSSLRTTLSHWS